MKVGIITFHFVNNFGGSLQAYALSKVVSDKFNIDCEIVDYRHPFIRFTDFVRLFPITKNKKEMISGLCTMNARRGRLKRFRTFMKKNMKLSERYNGMKDFEKNPPNYDKLICGSDQIWNPGITLSLSPAYFLGFSENKQDKIAYAPSFGNKDINAKYKQDVAKLISDIGYVSVREESGRNLIKEMTDMDVPILIDPTFLLEKEEWEKTALPSSIKEPYILLYIMQKDDEVYEYARKIKEKLGIKIVEISRYGYQPDCVDETLIDVGPAEFVGLFKDASYVCTNSFHGLAFSLIFEKDFCLVPCKKFAARMENMKSLFQLKPAENGLDSENLTTIYDKDFVRELIRSERAKSYEYLENALRSSQDCEKTLADSPKICQEKEACCGCGACEQACPKGCIHMALDNEGFYYPAIDTDHCIHCGKCEKVCPVLLADHACKEEEEAGSDEKECIKAFGGWHDDPKIRKDSSSGGAFTLLAESVIKNGGIVFGCALNKKLEPVHIGVETMDDLHKLRGSKYLQSKIGKTYQQVKEALDQGREVLFMGTPCQAAGLKAFLGGKEFPNLYIMDLICHGVPSLTVFQAYIKDLEKKYHSKVIAYRFRNKRHGWNQSGLQLGTMIRFENGKTLVHYPAFRDAFMNGFLDDVYLRPTCHDCRFKSMPKDYADFTIADFWGVDQVNSSLNDHKGTSLIIVNTEHGMERFEDVNTGLFTEVPYEESIRRNQTLISSTKMNKNRDRFFEDFEKKGFSYVRKRYMSVFQWGTHKAIKILKKKLLKK